MTYTFKNVDHVQLAAPVGKEQVAKDFYVGILGFQEIEKPKTLKQRGGVWFQAGNVRLHIGVEENFVPAKKAHPAIEVEQLEALRKNLEHRGIKTIIDTRLPGADRFYVYDPFGNRIEFLEWI